MLNLFDVLVKPILIYGSDVWGIKSKLWDSSDKVFLQYVRCLLHVKATTSNVITTEECGSLPPSMNCQIAALCYPNRLHHMDDNKLAKQVYYGLVELNHQGSNTWATDALRLANDLGLDISMEKMYSLQIVSKPLNITLLACGLKIFRTRNLIHF